MSLTHDQIHSDKGITRKKVDNNNFEYYYIKNNKKLDIVDKDVDKNHLNRIKQLKIPPQWIDVWISIDSNAKIQAIGTDSKERKQYIYHNNYLELAEKKKFIKLLDFIKALPNFNQIIEKHSKLHIYNIIKVITTMIKIVNLTYMRVGKEQYAQHNKSYGISSLKKSHMKIAGDIVTFNFMGKSKQRLNYVLRDPDIRSHLLILNKLDGDKLFQYIDENNKVRHITDLDINTYIQQYMGTAFSIKDFRTYASNYHFISSLLLETQKRLPKNQKIIKKNIMKSLEKTAKFLKHTKAISKKSYVMNYIIELYMNDSDYFVKRKYNEPREVLIELLNMYKKSVGE